MSINKNDIDFLGWKIEKVLLKLKYKNPVLFLPTKHIIMMDIDRITRLNSLCIVRKVSLEGLLPDLTFVISDGDFFEIKNFKI